jgi:uncharacterized protein (DUF427 family)
MAAGIGMLMSMVKAVWNGIVLAESADTVVVEGNHYFPLVSLNWEHFRESPTRTRCGWGRRVTTT